MYTTDGNILGEIYFWFDIIYVVFNAITNVGILGNDIVAKNVLRIVQSILSVTIVFKSLYFLKLFD